jgi:hypothetical protein
MGRRGYMKLAQFRLDDQMQRQSCHGSQLILPGANMHF